MRGAGNLRRASQPLALSLALALVFSAIPRKAAALPPPPEYVELTPDTMKRLGLEYRVYRNGESSAITLFYPARIHKKLRPRYMEVHTRDRKGQTLQRSRSDIGEEGGSVNHSFNHRQVDLTISVEYGEPYVYASTIYGIRSVSAFFTKHVKPSDLLPPPLIEYKP